MPQTYQQFRVWEAGLLIPSYAGDAGGERGLSGDIITVREPTNGVGLREMGHLLYLRIDGLDDYDMQALMEPLYEGETWYDKRRYCIPFERLNELHPLDFDRLYDVSDVYQPFLHVDSETGLYLFDAHVFNVDGLVFDKMTQTYI